MKTTGFAVLLCLFGCVEVPVEKPITTVSQDTFIAIPQNDRTQIDILFMIDNSPSMEAMATELRSKFGQFLQVFRDLADAGIYADLQIGVVTSDYGAGHVRYKNCDASPGGQMGLLQAIGAHAAPGCVAPIGTPFIKYAFRNDAPVSNLPSGSSLEEVFTCMASVGSDGCGFEHPLESVFAALRNTRENAGFVRDGALLAVVFVTNEDDASADPDVTFYDPSPTAVAAYGAYDTFRQTRYGVVCGNTPMPPPYDQTPSPLSECVPAPNDRHSVELQYDVSRYINLFGQPPERGGLKFSPNDDIILFGINAPETPFDVILAETDSGNGSGAKPAYAPCSAVGGSCAVRLQHSCQNRVAPAFFGDPPVRLNTVIRSIKSHSISNICGNDPDAAPQYDETLKSLATLISNHIPEGCIPAPLKTLDGSCDLGQADCVVEEITHGTTDTTRVVPSCARTPGVYPCWKVESKAFCGSLVDGVPRSPQGIGVTVDRNGVAAPPNTTAQASCNTNATAIF